jgi:hypothetical protein
MPAIVASAISLVSLDLSTGPSTPGSKTEFMYLQIFSLAISHAILVFLTILLINTMATQDGKTRGVRREKTIVLKQEKQL